MRVITSTLAVLLTVLPGLAPGAEPEKLVRGGLTILNLLLAGPGHPRNSEGAFVALKDGRILFAYSKFTGGSADEGRAYIAGRYSSDGGATWTAEDVTVLANEGAQNVMSVSLLRLKDGRIAFFYVRKNSDTDCIPYLRFSSNETRSWSKPVRCIPDDGYFVLNNDRVVQLRDGRLLLPVAIHSDGSARPVSRGRATVYLSDNVGRTWRRARTVLDCPTPSTEGLQEPGIIPLKGGRLMMYMRTRLGSQYESFSSDQGETWSAPKPSNILSPQSPALIKRIPKTGDLLLVWNDHSKVDPSFRAVDQPAPGQKPFWGQRTPLTVAISRDEGKTWVKAKNIEDHPKGQYAYPAVLFTGNRVLLAYSSGGEGAGHLGRLRIAYFSLKWLYQ